MMTVSGGQPHGVWQRQQIVLPGGEKRLHLGGGAAAVQGDAVADVVEEPCDEGTPPSAADNCDIHGYISL